MAASDILRDIFWTDLKKICYLNQPVLTNIRQTKVSEEGHIIEGDVEWNCEIISPVYSRKAKIGIKMPIVEGILLKPVSFYVSSGLKYSLNERGIQHAMRTPDKPHRTFYAPGVERALQSER